MKMREAPEIEVLNDPSDALSMAKATRRRKLIEAASREANVENFDPNGAERCNPTGIPSKGVY